jgi:hypothetical protein
VTAGINVLLGRCLPSREQSRQLAPLARIPDNQGYFRGPIHVARVRAWRTCHARYWRRARPLQSHLIPQPRWLLFVNRRQGRLRNWAAPGRPPKASPRLSRSKAYVAGENRRALIERRQARASLLSSSPSITLKSVVKRKSSDRATLLHSIEALLGSGVEKQDDIKERV